MKKNLKKLLPALLACLLLFAACGQTPASAPPAESTPPASAPAASTPASQPAEEVTILVAAAASLEKVYTEEIIPAFNALYPHIKVEGTYDSSGKLQTQIEEGLAADVFMSAATKQMNALVEGGYITEADVVALLENQIVLVAPADSDTSIDSFEKITEAESIALGDPESVPAGQYAQEALTSLGVWEQVQPKASFGTNVTEVLHWVAAASADVGIVYATDAASSDGVKVLAQAPEGALAERVIYPVAPLSASAHAEEAALFMEFLQGDAAMLAFTNAGFTPNA